MKASAKKLTRSENNNDYNNNNDNDNNKEGAELPDQVIRTLGEKETYKYVGILEADTIKQQEIKEKIKKEYICHCLPPNRTWHKVNDPKADYRGFLGRGRSGTNRGSNSASLCCSLTH